MKIDKIVYYIATGLLTALMLFSANMYFTETEMVRGFFTKLGYPSYLVIPLAILKILGLFAIWTRWSPRLKEWAYFGFLLDVVLAATAHIIVKDGAEMMAIAGMAFVIVSYIFDKRVFGKALV